MKFPKTILVLVGISLLCSCATPQKKIISTEEFFKLPKDKTSPFKIPPEEKPKIKIIEKKVIAVMKFENLSKNPKFDWLCDGIASTLVSKLGNVKKIRLVERSQVVKSLQEINFNMSGVVDEKTAVSAGKILGAEIMVIGEFQKSADQMRITARFVDVATGNIINTAEATGGYNDIFSLQDKIAFNLLKTLGIKVKVAEQKKIQKKPTESLTAYEWVEKASEHWSKKEEKITEEDINLIIKYCKKALKLDSDYMLAHYNLGVAYKEKGLYDKAIEEYKEAIRLNPDFAYAHCGLGVAYGKRGLWKKAIEEYKEAIEIDLDYEYAHFNLGLAYEKRGLNTKATEEFKEVIRINPNLADAHYNLGVAYRNKGLYDKAIEECKEAIRLNPDFANAHCNLGFIYRNKGLYDKAIKEYKEAIRIKPDFANAHYNLGLVYENKGLYNKAIEEHKEAIRIKPDFAYAHYGLGGAYYEQRLFDKAIEEFKEAIRINPDFANVHYGLGVIYSFLGRRGDALEEYKILKDLDKKLANKLFNFIYK
ncbi:tetratricopeptide repeat protein [bacterium]|nr:tetratricopeptide repeat protein [bacterium]